MLHFILILCLLFILSPLGSLLSVVTQFYQQLKYLAEQSNHRQLFCIQGTLQWCFEQASAIIEFENNDYKWCGESPTSVETCHYLSLLGQDVHLLFMNMHQQFDANMFAAAEGAVCGGSIIVLLLPDQTTIDDKQQQAIKQIINTVKGHRRRPLVITANRGRGKSASLGIAAATLINQGLTKIIICAPSKQATTTIYKHATLTLMDDENLQRLIFMPPDALKNEQPECDLLIIDEAAAIPVKLLISFTKRYSRIVYATTQFGYEGSGRGFALRFQQQLNNIAPEWRSFQLTHPIRWAENDPVETFTLTSLCLIEQSAQTTINDNDLKPTISIIEQAALLGKPELLNQLFSLLVNAHYQTKPSDLASLLNDQNLTIIAMRQDQEIIAVSLISHEGRFDQTTSEQIYQGKRRPNGHLIAQSLTFHSGFKNAATHSFARIQRIAVQPKLQRKQLGSQLLQWIINWAATQQFDHLSASFAASDNLLQFWLRHQLQVVRIGIRKDKSSGQHSFMVNLPLSPQGKELHYQIQTDFHKQVKVQVSRQLRQLDSSLIITLWPNIAFERLKVSTQQALSAYVNANRSYDNVEYLLIELLYSSSLTSLTSQQQRCLVEKVIQNHSWQEIIQQHHFTGQKQAQAFVKKCIDDLLTQQIREHTT